MCVVLGRSGKLLLTYAAIWGSSSGVGGVRGVELEARGGHCLWVGHGDVTGEEARLEGNREEGVRIRSWEATLKTKKEKKILKQETTHSNCFT